MEDRKKTDIPCPMCNCKLVFVVTEFDYIPNYYICPKCVGLFFEDNPAIVSKKTS